MFYSTNLPIAASFFCKVCYLSFLVLPYTANAAELSLSQVQQLAIENDPWLAGNRLQEQALIASSDAAATLPDPLISVGLANLPTDTFRFNQEPMTQFKVGLSQQLSRGDSLSLKRQQMRQQAAQHPYLRQDRQAKIKVMVAELWLTMVSTQQRIKIIEQSRPLFLQLVEIVEAHYSSAQGSTRQQDIVNAQLELARLEDRLSASIADRATNLAKLSQWLYTGVQLNSQWIDMDMPDYNRAWPSLPTLEPAIEHLLRQQDRSALAQRLAQHPAILAIEQQIKVSRSAIQIAQQQYQPQWAVNASYALRDNDPLGNDRADFFSIGVSVDIPFFTAQKQDKALLASRLQAESVKTDKLLALRSLLAQLQSTWQTFDSINQRIEHYETKILPQMAEQSEAALTAYTTDDGNFSDVMRANIAQLNTELELIQLHTAHALSLVQLDYYFNDAAASTDRINNAQNRGEQP
ncbi:TolC family protein [Paraglaciecola sp.]|uniref:TolC family protein n=1 Tax=Paraglaciecola sp. TaxID=1920173 RepID=UPI00273E37B2|nr:TolC family protein [Paraglaciecola sp.]MDP5032479.1 TolC family protein [Paraglaciecola sp.]